MTAPAAPPLRGQSRRPRRAPLPSRRLTASLSPPCSTRFPARKRERARRPPGNSRTLRKSQDRKSRRADSRLAIRC